MHLAIMLVPQYFVAREMVYRCHEHPQQLALVQEGAFAAVAFPSRAGGVPEPNPFEIRAVAGVCRILEDSRIARRRSLDSLDIEEADEALAAMQHNSKVTKKSQGMGLLSGSLSITWPNWLTASRNVDSAATGSSSLARDKDGCTRSNSSKDLLINLRTINGNDRRARRLWPYKFFCHGNYFGESELFANIPRSCSVRCESPEGLVLELQKNDFLELVEAFPEYGAIWRAKAARREATRMHLLQRLRRGSPYRVLAASLIQERFRELQIERARLAAVSGRKMSMASTSALHGEVAACRVTLVFLPGPLGILVDKEMGLVTAVAEDSQASRAGVRVGWCLKLVDGERYSLPQLDRCIAGIVDFEVIFEYDAQVSPSLSARMESITSRGSSDFRGSDHGIRAGGERQPRWQKSSPTVEVSTAGDDKRAVLSIAAGAGSGDAAAAAASAVAAAAATSSSLKTSDVQLLIMPSALRRKPEENLALPVPDPAEDKLRGATKAELQALRQSIFSAQNKLEEDVATMQAEITTMQRKVNALARKKATEGGMKSVGGELLNL